MNTPPASVQSLSSYQSTQQQQQPPFDPLTQRARRTNGPPKRALEDDTQGYPNKRTHIFQPYEQKIEFVKEGTPTSLDIDQQVDEKVRRWLRHNNKPWVRNDRRKAEGDPAVRCRDTCLYWCGKRRRELVELDQEWRKWKGKNTRMLKLLRAEWHTQQVNPDHRQRMVFPEWEHLARKWIGEDWRLTLSRHDTTNKKGWYKYTDDRDFGVPNATWGGLRDQTKTKQNWENNKKKEAEQLPRPKVIRPGGWWRPGPITNNSVLALLAEQLEEVRAEEARQEDKGKSKENPIDLTTEVVQQAPKTAATTEDQVIQLLTLPPTMTSWTNVKVSETLDQYLASPIPPPTWDNVDYWVQAWGAMMGTMDATPQPDITWEDVFHGERKENGLMKKT